MPHCWHLNTRKGDDQRRTGRAPRPARVVTVGCSMGGYAAVRAALELDADVVLAFAPQVTLDPEALMTSLIEC